MYVHVQVNGHDVVGMSRPEVVQLLRESLDSVTLVVSRQEVEEEEQTNVEVGVACGCGTWVWSAAGDSRSPL